MIGSNDSAGSSQLFNKFVRLFKENGVPYSSLKGGNGVRNVAYSSTTDEWLVSGTEIKRTEKEKKITPLEVLQRAFNQVEISELDEISW